MSLSRTFCASVLLAVLLGSLLTHQSLSDPAMGQTIGPKVPEPIITNVTMSLKNISGTIVFRFTADGTCSPGADHVNVSFGVGNGTTPAGPPEEGWIEPIEMMFFGTGVSLRPTGPKNDPWSKWAFRLGARIPAGTDPEDLLDIIGGIFGNETPDMSGIDLSLFDLDILEELEGAQMSLFARAYLPNGTYGGTSMDITDKVVPSLLEFARSEGLLDDDDDGPDDTGDDGKRDDSASYWPLIIALFIFAEVLFLAMIIYIMRKRKARRRP